MRIHHLNDVLPHVEGRKDFVVKRTPEYTVVDYVFTQQDSFDHPARRECRGLKFAPDGSLLARPLHKFFNVGERPETQPAAIDWGRPHAVTEKFDGSMIHPAVVGPRLRLMTRMGLTDVASACEETHLSNVTRAFAVGYDSRYWTPSFEWVSPANRVVLSYPKDELYLLAMRTLEDGHYLPRDLLLHWAKDHAFKTPRVLATDAYGDWAGLARHVDGLEEAEGYVVWFADGSAVKVKAPWYVTRHRALDGLRFEHHVVRLVLDGGADDVLPMLGEDDRARLAKYSTDLPRYAALLGERISGRAERYMDQWPRDRKTYAWAVTHDEAPVLRPIFFSYYDSGDAVGLVVDMIRRASSSGPRLAALLEALGAPRWVP